MIFSFRHKWKIFGDLSVGTLYLVTVFILITQFGFIDIKDHNQLLLQYLAAGSFPIPPGYYLLIFLVDLVIRVKYSFVASAAIVLTFFHWWKFSILRKSIENQGFDLPAFSIFLLAFSFLFLSPIFVPAVDGPFWYLGKFTQTIWHNSTLICVFPFCLLLVWKTFDWLKSASLRDLGGMFSLGLIILLIKPSFVFCYIPALPIYVFILDVRLSKRLVHAIGLVSVLFALLMVEKHLIFSWDPVLDSLYAPQEQSQVTINPLKVWLKFSHEPVFDFFTSFPLLLAFLIFWRKRAFESPFFNFSLLLLFFALLVYLLLAETGFRELHGNFYWQIPIALFLCNLSIVYSVVGQFLAEGGKMGGKYSMIFSIYAIQFALGIAYWVRIFTGFTLS